MDRFVHLHTHSHYSLLDGLAKIDELVARTKELGMSSIALTDHGVLYGTVEFYKKATRAGIKPILGIEAYVAPGDRKSREPGERYFHLVLLAETNTGWKNLIKLITRAHLEGFYYKPRVDKELLREYHEGLIALSACLSGEVNRPLIRGDIEAAERAAREYEDIFGKGNFFLEIGDHPHIPEVVAIRDHIIALSKRTGIPLVATQDIHYAKPEDAHYHDILLAVQTGNKTSDDDRLSMKADDFSMTSPEQMIERFKDVPEAVTNTSQIAERCNVSLELGKILLPNFAKPEGVSANDHLRTLINERIGKRYSPEEKASLTVQDRLQYELGVIEKTGFADYFLIVQDLITWAKEHAIAVGPGRGSSAGSIISYVLGITDIDPLKYGLLFERFLNPDRVQMPDIDIDFADKRRDEVLAYARQKYGEDHVAQIITFGTMAARAGIRDAGRALGLSYGFCDQIAKLIPLNMKLDEAIKKVAELGELYEHNEDARKVLDAAQHLEGVARHASVHACGTVISKDPLTDHIPLQLAPQDKTTVITQLEMHAIEDLGLLKIDLLGLKNLTIIEDALRLIKDIKGKEIKISEIPLDDKKTFELLRRADTTGVFQFESSGMRRYMKEIKPTELEDLIALVALYRPGTLDAGMVPHYIARKHGREPITYLHPKLEPILKNTHGIGVYQEQMMQIARDLAGFTLSEADTLRKAIGKKIKSLLDDQKEKLVHGMLESGIDARTANAIWELFPPFARYGFNRSHAACYALIGYRTAYLKAHYPEEFFASLLNAELDDIERIAFLIDEAKHAHIDVLPPDVNASFVNFAPEGSKIRFGLLAIKNVGAQITEQIIEERAMRGPFANFSDFLRRVTHKDLNKKSLESMVKTGVFDSFGIERNQALQNLDDILRFHMQVKKGAPSSGTSSLFGSESYAGPSLVLKPAPAIDRREKLIWEKELLGLFISDHPLTEYKTRIESLGAKPIAEVRAPQNDNLTFKIAGMVSKIQHILTKSGQPMLFAKIEDFSPQALEIVVFNSTLTKTTAIWRENNMVVIQGRMSWRNGEPKMICDKAAELTA